MDLRLHAYLQNLLETAHKLGNNGSKAISEPLVEKMLADLQIQLEQRLMANLLDQLSTADQQAYADLMETDVNQRDVVDFLNRKLPNAAELIKKTLEQFSEDYIATVNYQPKS